ncbi:MAG: hypothetical protein KDK44_00560 [Chlamydiia bacterium]|nr:hypothetical protein [Chlamydiia bacterium]
MELNLPKALVDFSPWASHSSPIWTLAHYTLRRNLDHYPFPRHLSVTERTIISDVLKDALLKCASDKPLHLPLSKLSPLDKSFLTEQLFWNDNLQTLSDEARVYMPPSFAWQALINGNDHLTLQCSSSQADWTHCYRLLYDLESALSRNLNFGFSQQFGYLTSKFPTCGTGFTVQIYLHLPLLIHSQKLDDLLLKLLPEGISARSLNHSAKFVGDVVILYNPRSLGVAEGDLASRVTSLAQAIEREEKTLRSTLRNHPIPEWIDRITKAYGLLRHSYKLSNKEALSALSPLKLATDLGWLEGITDAKFNILFFKMRRGHLQFEPHPDDPTDTLRATLLKKAFAPTTLTI